VTDLAFDPTEANTVYVTLSGFDAGTPGRPGHVFKTTSALAGNNLITLVSIALGTVPSSACPDGVPSGADVTVAVIIQAVNNALNGCGELTLSQLGTPSASLDPINRALVCSGEG